MPEYDLTVIIQQSLISYGLVVVVGFSAALLIRLIVVTLTKQAEKTAAPAPAAAAPAGPAPAAKAADPAENDIAVIAAAAYAMLGAVRIVRIEQLDSQSSSWAASGRTLNQTGHPVKRR